MRLRQQNVLVENTYSLLYLRLNICIACGLAGVLPLKPDLVLRLRPDDVSVLRLTYLSDSAYAPSASNRSAIGSRQIAQSWQV